MVATLARLRLRMMRNTLLRETWRIVLLALGALYGLGLLVLAVSGLIALGTLASPATRDLVMVLLGSLLVLGWAIVPVVAFGLDDTLDPQRFTPYLAPTPSFAVGLVVAGVVSIPGLVTVLVSLATAVVWVGAGSAGQRVLGAVVALVASLAGAAMCFLLARVCTTASSGLVRGRRGRDVVGLLGFAAILALAMLPSLLQTFTLSLATFETLGRVLSWTPIGAAWAMPADAIAGRWGELALRAVIVAVSLVVLAWLFLALLRRSMTSVGSGAAASGERTSRLPFAHGLIARARTGWLARLVTVPTAAVAGRAARYWRGDPRYLASLGAVLLLPAMALVMGLLVSAQEGVDRGVALGWASLVMAPLAAWLGAWSLHDDVAYDSSAFWLHVAAGVRGRDDRIGRLIAMAFWFVPVVVLLAVVPPVLLGRAGYVPAVLGLSLALLGSGYGVSSVMSAVAPYPVPPPGSSPLSTKSGGAMASMIAQMVSLLIVGVLVLPTVLTLIPAFAVSPVWGWVTLAVGLVSGVAWLILGVRRGAVEYDRRQVEMLTRIRSWPGH